MYVVLSKYIGGLGGGRGAPLISADLGIFH